MPHCHMFFMLHHKSLQVGSLFGWCCYISYTDVGDISSQQEIDHKGETYYWHPHNVLGNRLCTLDIWLCATCRYAAPGVSWLPGSL